MNDGTIQGGFCNLYRDLSEQTVDTRDSRMLEVFLDRTLGCMAHWVDGNVVRFDQFFHFVSHIAQWLGYGFGLVNRVCGVGYDTLSQQSNGTEVCSVLF